MQQPTNLKPMTIRGTDGRPHLASDMKPQASVAQPVRIRPIVPSVFRTPD